jgi:hypothetical protein
MARGLTHLAGTNMPWWTVRAPSGRGREKKPARGGPHLFVTKLHWETVKVSDIFDQAAPI